jgi:hypothetical protein
MTKSFGGSEVKPATGRARQVSSVPTTPSPTAASRTKTPSEKAVTRVGPGIHHGMGLP